MVKIALVANVLPQVGGVGTFIDALAEALEAKGHQVDVVSALGRRHRFSYLFPAMIRPLRILLAVECLMLTVFFASQWWLAFRIHLLQRRHGYDVVHAQDVSAACALSRLRVPVVLTMHGCLSVQGVGARPPGRLATAVFRSVERKALRRAQAVVAVSSVVRQHICNLSSGMAVIIVRNLASDRFHPANLHKSEAAGPLKVLFAGRLVAGKGVHLLLEALSLLDPGTVHLSVAGDGPERRQLEVQARLLGVAAQVTWLGAVSPANMHQVMTRSSAVVVPSLTGSRSAEGTPMVLLEALACGIPVIASNSGGMPDIIEDGVTGLLVPAGDSGALAIRLRMLAEDGSLRQRLGKQGREYFGRFHSPTVAASVYTGIYQQVLEERT